MGNCIIRNNRGTGVLVNRDATVDLRNCYIECEENKYRGVHLGDGGLAMQNCTIYKASEALTSYLTKTPEVFVVTRSAFIKNRQNLKLGKTGTADSSNTVFQQNMYTPSGFWVFGENYGAQKWGQYQQATGLDADSLMQEYDGTLPPFETGVKIYDMKIGANLK